MYTPSERQSMSLLQNPPSAPPSRAGGRLPTRMSLGSEKLQSRGRSLVDALQEQLAVPPTPSIASMSRSNSNSIKQMMPPPNTQFPNNGATIRNPLSASMDGPPIPRSSYGQGPRSSAGPGGYLMEQAQYSGSGSGASSYQEKFFRQNPPSDPPPSAGGMRYHRALGSTPSSHNSRRIITPTFSEISNYVHQVAGNRHILQNTVNQTRHHSAPLPPLREERENDGGIVVTFRDLQESGKEGENWLAAPPNQFPSPPKPPESKFEPLEELTPPPDQYHMQMAHKTGYSANFIRNIEPTWEFPHLQPTLPPPMKPPAGIDLFLQAHQRHEDYRARTSSVLSELPLGSRGVTRGARRTVEEILADLAHGRSDNTTNILDLSTDQELHLQSGDFVPKDKIYSPKKKSASELEVEEYNRALQELNMFFFNKGKHAMHRQFEDLDHRRTGSVSKEEMRNVINKLNPGMSKGALDTLFQNFSVGEEYVDYSAFCEALHHGQIPFIKLGGRQWKGPDPALPFGDPTTKLALQCPYAIQSDANRVVMKQEKQIKSRMQDIHDMFMKMDRKKNGKIQHDDFWKVMKQVLEYDRNLKMSDSEIKKLWRNADRDWEGEISIEDFLLGMSGSTKKLDLVPEFLKPKNLRGSVNGPIWEWVVPENTRKSYGI